MLKYRKATWALIVWCVVIALWLVTGLSATHCADQACNAGKGIGAALILFVGFCGFVVLSLIWLMSRPKDR